MTVWSRTIVAVGACVLVASGSASAFAQPTSAIPATAMTGTARTTSLKPSVYLGDSGSGERLQVTVRVPESGRYSVQYFVQYPQAAGTIRTRVDDRRLPVVQSPARPGTFGVYVRTEAFRLQAGRHTFVVRPDVPYRVSAVLVDARTPPPGS